MKTLHNAKATLDGREVPVQVAQEQEELLFTVPSTVGKGSALELFLPCFTAAIGEEGYFLIADGTNTYRTHFHARQEPSYVAAPPMMPVLGACRPHASHLAVVEGMAWSMHTRLAWTEGECFAILCFSLCGLSPYEDIRVRLISVGARKDDTDLAVAYRTYRQKRGDWIPLGEKASSRPAVAYAAASPEIRIRMGWKPAPPTVLEQTRENEPPMHVACTFPQVGEFLRRLKAAGVDKAQICLVGWNRSGHDGRWPEAMPPDPRLGGEEELRRLIREAKDLGYQIVCHTNSTDAYSIAEGFHADWLVKKANGEISVDANPWSGGRMYHVCPERSLDIAREMLPPIADLGFRGLHYIDVMTVATPRFCHDPRHPSNPTETVAWYRKLGQYAAALFGGFASEGVYDFATDFLDYGLYVSWDFSHAPVCDENVPFWSVVYHGSVLANPSTHTVNYPIKRKEDELYFWECGGRLSFYIYSKFMSGSHLDNWLGKDDLGIGTEEELNTAVQVIAHAYRQYAPHVHLQYQPILARRKIAPGIIRTEYQNGSYTEVNYGEGTVSFGEKT